MSVTSWEYHMYCFIIIQEQFKQEQLHVSRRGEGDLVTGALRVPDSSQCQSFVGMMVNDGKMMVKLQVSCLQKNLSSKYLLLTNECDLRTYTFFNSENKAVVY